VATLHELERQLEEVRFCGYTWSHAERDKGLGSVAVPLVNKDGIAHKAISVSARPARIKPEKEPLWIETIQSTASEMLDSLWGDY